MTAHVVPGPCFCGHDPADHHGSDHLTYCQWCRCGEYVEHAAYIQALDTLNTDDWLADDHGLRDNRAAALDLARRRTA